MTRVKPRILLTLSRPTERNRPFIARYRQALERAGAEVVEVYPGDPVPDGFDGLLLAGGGDIDPARYGDEDTACAYVDADRDELEFTIARQAIDRDIPILGICRGFQVINVVRGGKLVQDLPGHESLNDELVQHHHVRPRPGSILEGATGGQSITVNSRHHQGVTPEFLGRGLVATVEVDDLIEAFEATDRRWMVGVQWHPEQTHEVSAKATLIFDTFVAEAATARNETSRP